MHVNAISCPSAAKQMGRFFCTKKSIRISIQQQTIFNQLLM